MTHKSYRRYHRKSRNGCTVCKARHMKCDELRPSCSNCKVSARRCHYALQPTIPRPPLYDQELNPTTWLQESGEQLLPAIRDLSPEKENEFFTLRHLSLFHHVERNMVDWMMVTEAMNHLIDIYINSALSAPYLMNQLLALSAMHLSTAKENASEYRIIASKLQNQALRGFNRSLEDTSNPSVMSQFLFSSLLAMHYLADKVAVEGQDFDTTFQNMIAYFRLHRGARIMGDRAYNSPESTIKQFISAMQLDGTDCEIIPPASIEIISEMLRRSDLNEQSMASCQEASWALKFAHHRLDGPNTWGVHALMAWPNMISTHFISLLEKRTPEALVILAHYCVLLDRFSAFWCIGGAGERVGRGIAGMLSGYWAPWLPMM